MHLKDRIHPALAVTFSIPYWCIAIGCAYKAFIASSLLEQTPLLIASVLLCDVAKRICFSDTREDITQGTGAQAAERFVDLISKLPPKRLKSIDVENDQNLPKGVVDR